MDRAGAGGGGGGRGAAAAGGGGGGADGLAEGGGGGAGAEGFRNDTGGFDEPGNGGGDFAEIFDITEDGLEAGRGGGFLRFATNGLTGGAGGASVEGGGGGRFAGIFGADPTGGLGGREVSESDRYGEASLLAPVSTPPRLRSLGMPPAKSPANWGAAGAAAGPLSLPGPVSLLLRNRFAPCPGGTGGASPLGGFDIPGTGGAEPSGGPPPDDLTPPPTCGADRSFVTAFFSFVPFEISESRAP